MDRSSLNWFVAFAMVFVALLQQDNLRAQEAEATVGDIVIEAITPGKISAKREREAIDLAFDYLLKHGKATPDEDVAKAILTDFQKRNPSIALIPKTPLLTADDCEKAAAQSIVKATDEKYPIKTKEQLEEEAKHVYPLYNKGDHVKVIFAKNPQFPTEVNGVYYGTNRGIVQVGTHRIRIDDMLLIEDYREEVLKFNPEATAELRDEYIKRQQHNTARGREDFIDNNSSAIIQKEIAAFAQKNEENGYTCIEGTWLTLMPFLTAASAKAHQEVVKFENEKHNEKVEARLDEIKAQADTLALQWSIVPQSARLNPSDTLKEIAMLEKKKADAEAKRKAEEEARKEEAEAKELEAEEARRAASAQANAVSTKTSDEEVRLEEEKSRQKMKLQIIIAVVALVVIVAIVLIVLKIRSDREKTRFKRFFEGKGKLQKDFWDMAAADPKNFKYVAYMFPDLKSASRALTRLTYIQAMPNGELKCKRDILFGVYPHQNGAVAFLGGTKFHYALWREASAILPEIEGAQYFKVSEEPEVKLDIPDLKQLGKEGEIESLGMEDTTDAEGSFTRCYKYKTHNREVAMEFLENFQINEEGIVVQVQTDDGILSKDENGIFQN